MVLQQRDPKRCANLRASRSCAPARSSRDAVHALALLRAARRGDRGARERLVVSHLGLIRALALRYHGLGLPDEDLVQEGSLGLLEAIDHYDPRRGADFESFCRFHIRRAMRNALTEQAHVIRLPKRVVERRRALDRSERRLAARNNGRTPTYAELAEETGLPVSAVVEARAAGLTPVSLDETVSPDGSSLASLVADPSATDPERAALAHERRRIGAAALDTLPDRQRLVVRRRWGLDGEPSRCTELAKELGLSPRRTQTIGADGLRELRRKIESGLAG